MAKEKIIGLVVDTSILTLYRPDGSKIEIRQGDKRIKSLVDEILPIVQQGGVAEVDLDVVDENPYKDFQELATSAIQFFRVAKKVVAPLLEQAATVLETAQQTVVSSVSAGKIPETISSEMSAAVDEIIKNAEPATSENFREPTEEETVVAVVDTPTGKKAVPGMENLKEQLIYANKLGSSKGVESLIERMAAVAEDRMHSVQDLLHFLKQADLPIADDGSIIAYKILRHGTAKGTFVDCHTKNVVQRVGSFVCIDEKLIDKNRSVECSSGLHICRRGYVGTFSGDTVTLVKVAPEDVIVVPHNDHNKVRVRGYHLIFELDEGAYSKLKNNSPMTDDPKIAKLVTRAIKGDHIERTEEVCIRGKLGTDIVTTQLNKKKVAKKAPEQPTSSVNKKSAAPKPVHTALDDPSHARNKVDPKKVAETASAPTRQQEARTLMDVVDTSSDPQHRKLAAQKLLDLKKSKKIGWDRLGISEDEVERLQAEATQELPAEPVKSTPNAQPLSRAQQARLLFKAKDWAGLWALKRRAKVNWQQLGFFEKETATINKHKPKEA